jgi:hypothetical protein
VPVTGPLPLFPVDWVISDYPPDSDGAFCHAAVLSVKTNVPLMLAPVGRLQADEVKQK